jgi:hypothetical protein
MTFEFIGMRRMSEGCSKAEAHACDCHVKKSREMIEAKNLDRISPR